MNPAVYIHASKQGLIKHGHPWIFPKAIKKEVGHPKAGELVQVYNEDGQIIGIGVYNQHSLYRVRMLALASEQIDFSSLESIISYRLSQAMLIRQCLSLPSSITTAYRLFNSEGDGLSGLTIDRFNKTCVVSSSAYWVEANKAIIIEAIHNLLPDDEVLWLPHIKSLTQDGFKHLVEERHERTERVLEGGVYYEVDFSSAQKTGLFLDQRDNHLRIAALASGKRVLDLYSYTGGFALHAAKAGATTVTAVDSSSQAIKAAQKNASINHLNTIDWIQADARDYLTHAANYDIIILDPPKLVPSQRHLHQAKNYYRFLHREVIKAMKPGSLLMTCNCSSALSSEAFATLVYSQALSVGKSARVLGLFGPSACHPTVPTFPEGNYLTAILLGIV